MILSRAAEGLVQRLLELEVPEIADGTVEIMAIARDPGGRSKVAVKSNRAEVDPIGACLGPKSSRIANVTDGLSNTIIVGERCGAHSPTTWTGAVAGGRCPAWMATQGWTAPYTPPSAATSSPA